MHLRDVLRGRHVPHACLIFAGERHVFRSADVIDRALQAELSSYGLVPGSVRPSPRI